ncbi:hypothetical protein HS088_TW21G01305 [Tripterygium wilfordii]|uniref:Uncharacterized protein n=1 Tax=Tripterygium wilfordii TaxID=458696 RepID=A0A7J7C5Q2_TRIWF|nr:hypothetical protein HS088_TW21G01305 [Tripterygium wilfordii]
MSSGDRFLARSISIIESNGFSFNGLNPVAKLEFLLDPSDTHLRKLPGMGSACSVRSFGCKDNLDRARFDVSKECNLERVETIVPFDFKCEAS